MSTELRLSSEKRLRIFTGRGYPELAEEVAAELGVPITPTSAICFISLILLFIAGLKNGCGFEPTVLINLPSGNL